MEKICRICKKSLDSSEFNKHPQCKDGLDTICKICQSAYRKKYYENNKNRLKLSSKIWYEDNHNKARLTRSSWRDSNKEKHLEHCKIYRVNNPDKIATNGLKRRISGMVGWANHDYIKLFYKLAKIESKELNIAIHVDHIVPIVSNIVCGLHTEHNLQLLTAQENCKKGNRVWPDMPH